MPFLAFIAFALLSTSPAFAQQDSGSYGPTVTIVSPEYSDVIKDEATIVIAITPRR